MKKEPSFKLFTIIMIISLFITALWNKLIIIKNIIHYILDPTFGFLLIWNATYGMLIIVFLISLFTIIVQKYFTDQETIKKLKEDQKRIQKEIKQYRGDPKKIMELQKKQLQALPRSLKLNLRPMIITSIPLLLLFRWFWDFFKILGDPKFFGFMSWFIFYLVFTLIFSGMLKKFLKVV